MVPGRKCLNVCMCGWVGSFIETMDIFDESRRILSLLGHLQVAGLMVLNCGVLELQKSLHGVFPDCRMKDDKKKILKTKFTIIILFNLLIYLFKINL